METVFVTLTCHVFDWDMYHSFATDCSQQSDSTAKN